MSFSCVKPPNTDNIVKDTAKVCEKPEKCLKKSQSSVPSKSRIPKQGKWAFSVAEKVGVHESSASINSVVNVEKQCEKPATPTMIIAPRTQSKSQEKPPVSTRARSIISMGSDCNERRVLENKFNQKKNRYITLIREIQDKQKLSVTSFKQLFQMRERILHLGGKDPCKLEEINPLGWRFLKANTGEGCAENNGNAGQSLLYQLESNLDTIAENYLNLCRDALEKRKEIVIWLTNFEREFWDSASELSCKQEIASQCEIFKSENSGLEKKLETIRHDQLSQVKELVLRFSFIWQECNLYKLEQTSTTADANESFCEDNEEKVREKEKILKMTQKLRKQETLLTNAEKKMQKIQENVKQLEKQLKEKETDIERRDKELAKLNKNESGIGKKGNFESRLLKLREEVEFKENELRALACDYTENINNLKLELENERKTKQDVEYQFDEFKTRHAKLEEKCKELLEVQNKRKEISLSNHHTEYEIQLFTELKEVRNLLAEKEKIIQKLQFKRNNLIEGVHDADQDNGSSNKKLTEELLNKSNELQTVRTQFAQLQKNYKRMQQHLEEKTPEMNRLQHLQMKDSSRGIYNVQIMQLQQQVTDLRSTLADVKGQNEGLEKTCMQLQLKLERYRHIVHNQDKDNKVRKEIQQLLQPNEDGYMDNVDQSNFGLINNQEFQQLYSTLENKEMQVMKLEKLVKQMEKQEEHSQLQRTRLETRIAKLELALKKDQETHRNRGFSFL